MRNEAAQLSKSESLVQPIDHALRVVLNVVEKGFIGGEFAALDALSPRNDFEMSRTDLLAAHLDTLEVHGVHRSIIMDSLETQIRAICSVNPYTASILTFNKSAQIFLNLLESPLGLGFSLRPVKIFILTPNP